MSQRLQNELAEMAVRVVALEERVAELEALLRAITRSSTPKGKAA